MKGRLPGSTGCCSSSAARGPRRASSRPSRSSSTRSSPGDPADGSVTGYINTPLNVHLGFPIPLFPLVRFPLLCMHRGCCVGLSQRVWLRRGGGVVPPPTLLSDGSMYEEGSSLDNDPAHPGAPWGTRRACWPTRRPPRPSTSPTPPPRPPAAACAADPPAAPPP